LLPKRIRGATTELVVPGRFESTSTPSTLRSTVVVTGS
jgi:hypothetical protein